MSLARIGAIEFSFHGDPAFRWTSQPNAAGMRSASINGMLEWDNVHQLSELLANGVRSSGFAGETGVLDYLDFTDDLLRPYRGWYLLDSCDVDASRQASLSGLVSVAISATHLGPREPVLLRSARPKTDDFSLTAQSLAVYPFAGDLDEAGSFLFTPGGTRFTRDGESGPVVLHAGTVTTDADELDNVVTLGEPLELDATEWVTDRTVDVRAYDRREQRTVHGPHMFAACSDARLDNGIVRLICGPRGMAAHIRVEAWSPDAGVDGDWTQAGCVCFDQTPDDLLQSVRLLRITPEEGVLALAVRNRGEILVTLRRGERMLRIASGRARTGTTLGVRWLGIPPYLTATGTLATDTAKFGDGLDLDVGVLEIAWPLQVSKDAWSIGFWWRPDDDDTTQPDSGLASIFDSVEQVGSVEWLSGTKQIRWTQGANTLDSAPITFSAAGDVGVQIGYSTAFGMRMTTIAGAIVPETATVENTTAPDSGTDDANFRSVYVAATSTGFDWGDGDWGDGNWGGVQYAAGIIDNLQLFEDLLTAVEQHGLLQAGPADQNLPVPEARLVLYVPFDTTPLPAGSAYATGRRFESTVQGGATRSPDGYGFTKAIATLRSGAYAADGLAVLIDVDGEAAAYLATTGDFDDLADYQAQLAAQQFQEVRVR